MPLLTYEQHAAIMKAVQYLHNNPPEQKEVPYTGWKMTPEKVREIRKSDKTTKDLAKEYDVCYRTVMEIRLGRTWKHVENE